MENNGMSVGERCKLCCSNHWRGWLSILIPVIFSPLLFMTPIKEFRCAYVVCVMAFLWVTEAMPLYVTSLFPIVLFPVFGILDSEVVCMTYFKDSLIFFFGALVIAIVIEHCNLHVRIALNVINIVGCSPRKLHLSVSIVSMFISMWIANSATTAMMCPIVKAILTELESQGLMKTTTDQKPSDPEDPPYPTDIVICYYLGVAYSASIGGCGTLIGTGTNFVLKGNFETRFPDATDSIEFFNFMLFNVPPMLLHTLLVFLWLEWAYMGLFRPRSAVAQEISQFKDSEAVARDVVKQRKGELGTITMHELQVAIFFILMVVVFLGRKPGFMPGWSTLFTEVEVKNSMPTTLIVVLFFLIPVNYLFMKYCICAAPNPEGTRPSLLNWKVVHDKFPWGILFLLGGGFALAKGITDSGFAKMVGQSLSGLKEFPPPVVQLICITVAIIATNFSANMAILNILAPVLMEMAIVIKIHPLYLLLPTGIACSMAFHFPVSTPPNAIISEAANVRTKDMAFGGIGPSIICIFGFWFFSQFYAPLIWPSFQEFPEWATSSGPATTTVKP